MAVKPLTQPEYWATDAVYTTGPFIGQPQKVIPPGAFAAEGHRPGSLFPTPAEYENSQQYNLTGLARWVFLGSSAGAADAHIVETDSTGRATLHGLTVNDTVDETAVAVFSASTGLNPAMLVTCTGGAPVIGAALANASASAFMTALGTGAAATGLDVVMLNTPAGGAAVRVQTDNLAAAPGISVTHQGTGIGIEVTASGSGRAMAIAGGTGATAATVTGGSGQAAMLVSGGNNAAVAAQFIGAGTSLGVVASGGSASSAATGIRGDALHADAVGVHGRTSTSASTAASGVHGEARGVGTTGVFGDGGTVGRGLVVQADASSPTYAAMRIVPQDADPTAGTSDGELYWSADHRTLRTSVSGYGWRSMLSMGPGSAFYIAASQATNTADLVGGVYGSLLQLDCIESDGTGIFGGAGQLTFSCDVRSVAGTATYINIRVTDTTNAVTVAEWNGAGTAATDGFLIALPSSEWQRAVTFGLKYDPGVYGDMSLLIEISATPTNAEVRNATATFVGTV